MYCKKCGRYIGTDDDYCEDCAPASVQHNTEVDNLNPILPDINVLQPSYDEVVEPVITKTFGLAKAIMACCFGFVGLIVITWAAVALYNGYVDFINFDASVISSEVALDNALNALLDGVWHLASSIPCAVLAMVFGFKAIAKFKYASSVGNLKPVTTLIFGVIGCVLGGYAIIYAMGTSVLGVMHLIEIINFV